MPFRRLYKVDLPDPGAPLINTRSAVLCLRGHTAGGVLAVAVEEVSLLLLCSACLKGIVGDEGAAAGALLVVIYVKYVCVAF